MNNPLKISLAEIPLAISLFYIKWSRWVSSNNMVIYEILIEDKIALCMVDLISIANFLNKELVKCFCFKNSSCSMMQLLSCVFHKTISVTFSMHNRYEPINWEITRAVFVKSLVTQELTCYFRLCGLILPSSPGEKNKCLCWVVY